MLLISVSKRQDWNDYIKLAEDENKSIKFPNFAKLINDISSIEFCLKEDVFEE